MRTLATPFFLLTLAVGACADAPTEPAATPGAAPDAAAVFPAVIPVPNGFAADGIAFGPGTTFYVGSLANGAIWRGDAVTGAGSVLAQPPAGRAACGVAYDGRTNRLFVAGAQTGQAYVYDATTGATLAVYQLSDPAGSTDVQSVTVLGDAVYFTDIFQPVLYRIPLGPNGQLPQQSAVQVLPYAGDFQFVPDGALNTSGIVGTPDGRWLLVVNVTTGALYRVDPTTAQTTAIDLGSGSLAGGDGLALVGRTLYVVQVLNNQVAVVNLNDDFTSGVIQPQALQNPALDFPGHLAAFGSAVYVVNAHLELDPGPDVPYQVIRLSR